MPGRPVLISNALALEPASLRARAQVVWTLAWPVIIAFSLESLVGLCDALMVGRLGATAVAAVGIGVHVLSAVNLSMFAVGTGTLAIVARHVGAGERRAAEAAVEQSILAAVVLSAVVAIPVAVWAPAVVSVFRVPPEVAELGTHFIRLLMLAVPPDAVVFVVASSLRAAGDTRTPLVIGAVVGVVNLVVGYVLIFGPFGLPALGVTGAAIGSVTAFAVGAVLGVWLLGNGRLRLAVRWRDMRPDLTLVRRVLRVGYPAALEHLIMQVGFLAYIFFAARYGTHGVAAYFIGVRILALSFLPGFGFGAAAGTLVGQALGARRPDEAERSAWVATGLATAFMTTGGAFLLLAARPVARLFVDDPAVVDATVSFILVLGAAQPLMAIDFTLSGALRGAGDTRFPLAVALLAFYVFRLGAAWLVTFGLGLSLDWLWLALIGDYIVRAALKGYRFRSGVWKLVRV
jgi:putative MATE family efflux protein